MQQSFDPDIGIDNINYKQVAFQGIMGGVTSFAGGKFGEALQVDKWVSGIGSPLLRFMSQNIISNTVVGGTLGGFTSIANGGDFFEGAWGGIKQGLVTGAISGIAGSVQYSHDNKVNLLTGKQNSKLNVPNNTFIVTPNGVVLPRGAIIPSYLIENPNRQGSYGLFENGVFVEKVRIDPGTPPGVKGPNNSHFHLNGSKTHIFDFSRWPWWRL